jgi:hypothetical protein
MTSFLTRVHWKNPIAECQRASIEPDGKITLQFGEPTPDYTETDPP